MLRTINQAAAAANAKIGVAAAMGMAIVGVNAIAGAIGCVAINGVNGAMANMATGLGNRS